MRRLICFLFFLFTLISEKLTAQNPWLPMNFEIYAGGPDAFYWDTVTDWFYIGGHMWEVDNKKVQRMFRIDSFGTVDYMDTVNPNLNVPLSIVKYKNIIYHAGISGLYTYQNKKWKKLYKDSTKLSPIIDATYAYKDKLLLGGSFTNATKSGFDGFVIEYDGNEFSPFEDIYELLRGKSGNAIVDVSDIIEYKGKLYLGGRFGLDSGEIYHNIISWDGAEWGNVGGGIIELSGWGGVNSMMVYKGELYVAGYFWETAGSKSNNILKWDGEQWYAIGNGVYGRQIYEMFVYHDELWVFGNIDSVDYLGLSKIAIWNGEYWCSPGGEIDLEIFAAAEYRDTLYIGGNFRHIDYDSTLKKMVKYNEDAPRKCGPPVEIIPLNVKSYAASDNVNIFPNPTSGEITIQFEHKSSPFNLKVFNILGKCVYDQSGFSEPEIKLKIPGNDGLYIIQINGKDGMRIAEKVLKSR